MILLMIRLNRIIRLLVNSTGCHITLTCTGNLISYFIEIMHVQLIMGKCAINIITTLQISCHKATGEREIWCVLINYILENKAGCDNRNIWPKKIYKIFVSVPHHSSQFWHRTMLYLLNWTFFVMNKSGNSHIGSQKFLIVNESQYLDVIFLLRLSRNMNIFLLLNFW